jgi:CubicO group peptidase (beta-lactamase class C family)
MKTIKYTIIILVAIFSFAKGLLSQPIAKNSNSLKMTRNQLSENIKDYIREEMSDRKITGLSIAVVDSAGVLLSNGFGFADKENRILADNNTIFPIASITKTFTGIAVMQLLEKGLIDLDQPIGNYIQELSLPNGEENTITTRMLLTHHSGIQGDILHNWYLPEVSKDPLVYEQIVELINEAGTIFPPGTMHSYCNAGYSLLGVLIHKVSGKHYVEYIRSEILSPLGMDNTLVFAGENSEANVAKGYDGKKVTSMPMKMGIPAGGMATSSDDAAKYIKTIINTYQGKETLLRTESLRQMMSQQNNAVPYDEGFSMGLSWFLQHPLKSHTKYASHRGELSPYHSMLVVLPEIETGVYIGINTNKAANAPDEMAHTIIKDLFEYHTDKKIGTEKKTQPVSMKKEELLQHEGYYPNVYFGPMKVIARKNKLLLKSSAMPMPLHLEPRSDSTYTVKTKLFGLIPLPVKMLEVLTVEFKEIENDKFLYFNIAETMLNPNLRIKPYTVPPEYDQYTGKYKVLNMDHSDKVVKNVKIKKSKDFYILKYTFLGRHQFNLVLKPVDKTNARIAGLGRFQGEKIQWKTENNSTRMHWSGLILEKE